VSPLPNSSLPTIPALMSPLFITFHQHLQLFPLIESKVLTKPMVAIVLALLVSMVLIPSSMWTESTALTLVFCLLCQLTPCHYNDAHVNATLISGSKISLFFVNSK
jgi:hypothetical protein